jgi:hypothetical protein
MTTRAASAHQESVSGAVAQRAAAEGLGQYRETFVPKRLTKPAVVGLVLVLPIAFALLVVPGVLLVWRLATFSPNFSRKQAAKRLHFYEHGILLAGQDGPEEVFRFDSMRAFQEVVAQYVNGAHAGTHYGHTLIRSDGSKLRLAPFFADPQRFGQILQMEIVRAQLPLLLAGIAQGRPADHGPIKVNREGLATPKGNASWYEIGQMKVDNGVLVIQKAGQRRDWYRVRIATIPNYVLFRGLTDHLRGV